VATKLVEWGDRLSRRFGTRRKRLYLQIPKSAEIQRSHPTTEFCDESAIAFFVRQSFVFDATK
jgi:hypothetical protein